MIKKTILFLAPAMLLGACSAKGAPAKVEIEVPEEAIGQQLVLHITPYDQEDDSKSTSDTVAITSRTMSFTAPTEEAYAYNINIGPYFVPNVYVRPGETAKINVTSYNPFEVTVSGTPLLEGMSAYSNLTDPLQTEYVLAREAGASTVTLDSIYDRFLTMTRDFIDKDPKSPAAVYALISLNGQEYLDYYDKLKPVVDESLFREYVEQKVSETRERVEAEKAQNAMVGKPAPAFTLKNLRGKDVSLAQFKGKWVVLDFWGSWCIWCIKGFPELKENYAKYAGQFEVVGIDCGDTPEQWQDAVKKYELPWVNVYNPKSTDTLTKAYNIQGFPTKIIVDPAGNVADVTVGEDPSFYARLANFLK